MSIYDELRKTIHKKRGTDIKSFLSGTQARGQSAMGNLESRRLLRSGAALRTGGRIQEAEKRGAHEITSASDVDLKRLELEEEREKSRKKWALARTLGSLAGTVAGTLLGGPAGGAAGGGLASFFTGQATDTALPSYQTPSFQPGSLTFDQYLKLSPEEIQELQRSLGLQLGY